MTRTSLTLVSALQLLGAGCLPPDSGKTTAGDGEPVVGKLKFNDRVVNLTPEVFADETNGVPREATAKIMADIVVEPRRSESNGETLLDRPHRPHSPQLERLHRLERDDLRPR